MVSRLSRLPMPAASATANISGRTIWYSPVSSKMMMTTLMGDGDQQQVASAAEVSLQPGQVGAPRQSVRRGFLLHAMEYSASFRRSASPRGRSSTTMHWALPESVGPAGAYGLVGMGAVFAAAASMTSGTPQPRPRAP